MIVPVEDWEPLSTTSLIRDLSQQRLVGNLNLLSSDNSIHESDLWALSSFENHDMPMVLYSGWDILAAMQARIKCTRIP